MSCDESLEPHPLRNVPSWLASALTHALALIVLALFTTAGPREAQPLALNFDRTPEEILEQFDELDDPIEIVEVAASLTTLPDMPSAAETPDEPVETSHAPPVEDGNQFAMPRDEILVSTTSGPPGGGVRNPKTGPPEAATAVMQALAWLAAHQMPDGGWNFDLTGCPSCRGQCRHSGSMQQARSAATAMALLPFLGAGETHMKGQHRETVARGLQFLGSRMKTSPGGASWHEPQGRMYSHGLAAIAVCEAYAMTRDRALEAPAQQSIHYIVAAQDPVGGGWRYEPRQPGDTSVVGWHIMALKSGHLAYLRVPPATIKRSSQFLDGVQQQSGAAYGYTKPGEGAATTAIGLLCRMHLGWKRENPALERGVAWLSHKGPSPHDMYYNYYATQVMRHYEGEPWEKWDGAMRPQLLRSQAKRGHERGSWHFDGADHGAAPGGRLYFTSLATMTLEVYYRHMPLYQRQSTASEFPL
jgi:hypothetical protein